MTPRQHLLGDKASLAPIQIEALRGDLRLSFATGFFYRDGEDEHLVTNWHVVSGRSPLDYKPLHSSGALPDRLLLHVPVWIENELGKAIGWKVYGYSLYNDEDCLEAKWSVHPEHGEKVDVAAIALSASEDTAVIPVTDPRLELEALSPRPGMDAFILGFPLGMTGGARLPIWKRGTVASEPDIDLNGLPSLFVDTATREGMSGAPVFIDEVGLWTPAGRSGIENATFGRGRMFAGCYSSRIGANDEFKAQLGVVWKASAVAAVVANDTTAKSSHLFVPQS